MRCLGAVVVILFALYVFLFSSRVLAGEVYIWTDNDGVMHISDDPRHLPPGGEVETVYYSERRAEEGQSLSNNVKAGDGTEEKGIQGGPAEKLSKTGSHHKVQERELQEAREEYERAKDLVEKRRRHYSHQRSRQSRDSFKSALKELAEKRDTLRRLEGKN